MAHTCTCVTVIGFITCTHPPVFFQWRTCFAIGSYLMEVVFVWFHVYPYTNIFRSVIVRGYQLLVQFLQHCVIVRSDVFHYWGPLGISPLFFPYKNSIKETRASPCVPFHSSRQYSLCLTQMLSTGIRFICSIDILAHTHHPYFASVTLCHHHM